MSEPQPAPRGERRRRRDRRRRQRLLGDWRQARRGRRRRVRRAADSPGMILDRYPPRFVAAALAALLLSMADAALSAALLASGAATEANPVARLVLAQGLAPFVWLKVACTGFAVVWMVLYARLQLFSRVPVSGLLYGVLAVLALLVAYELVLIV